MLPFGLMPPLVSKYICTRTKSGTDAGCYEYDLLLISDGGGVCDQKNIVSPTGIVNKIAATKDIQ